MSHLPNVRPVVGFLPYSPRSVPPVTGHQSISYEIKYVVSARQRSLHYCEGFVNK